MEGYKLNSRFNHLFFRIAGISIYVFVIIVSLSILLIHSAKAQDTTPPAPPMNLRIVNMSNTSINSAITIAWDANTEPDLEGYILYLRAVGETSFSPIAMLPPSTSYTIAGLAPGINILKITAFDSSGNESDFSNEVSVNIPSLCGDSILSPDEECDDGNTSPGDGCDDMCMVEVGWVCVIPGEPCRQIMCGDGLLEGAEQCDDGNINPSDGCDGVCLVEDGWVCEIPGAACVQITCGDGLLEGAEECDDSNLEDGDGCSSACQLEKQAQKVTPIPTLSQWGLIAMAGVLGIVGLFAIWKRKVAA